TRVTQLIRLGHCSGRSYRVSPAWWRTVRLGNQKGPPTVTSVTTPTTRAVAADPVALKRLGNAFCEAKLLLTATELGLFTVLDAGPATTEEIRATLKLGERGVRDFLDALVALGLLVRTAGRYRNGPAAEQFLVRDKESYSGGFLERANRMLYPAWGNLTEALRTGAPQAQAPYSAVAA